MKFAERIEKIRESKTVQFTALIKELKQRGSDVIDFAVGEPEYPTPSSVIDSTCAALKNGKTRYSPVQGIAALRSKIARDFDGYNGDNVLLSNGSKQSLYSIFQTICDPGDQVIIPRPYWVSFSEQVKLAGADPVFVDTIEHQLDCGAIEYAVTDRTKVILINSPNNPTGAVYPLADLEKIAALAIKHDLFIVADEAYAFFVYDGQPRESSFLIDGVKERCIVVRSFSKSYSMTGFRIGYIAASRRIIQAVAKLQSHLTGNVCTFGQDGALSALELDGAFVEKRRSDLQKKRDIAFQYTQKMFTCIKPRGAFYVFPDVSGYLKAGETSQDFAATLLEKAGVAVVPGEAFGMQKHIRISYALPEQMLVEGFERMSRIL